MWNRKKQEKTDLHQEKRYQFIREQVRPQKKQQAVLWLKRLGLLVIAACIFGGIAGGIMICIQNRFLKQEKDTVTINAYTPVPEETTAPAVGKDKNETGQQELTLNDMNTISRRLSAVGTAVDTAMVGIKSMGNAKNWFANSQSAETVAFGLIFQKSEKYYDILTTCDIVQEQSSVQVQLMDDTMIEGTILGSDVQLNMAVVRIKKADIKKSLLAQMSVAYLGNGLGMVDGTKVIAVGSPNGVLHSVVAGMITNDSIRASITDGEIQIFSTDIPYCEIGNGVVLDIQGHVIGMITADFTEETGTTGMAFVRISHVMPLLELLQKKKEIPYIGIEGKSLSAAAAAVHHLENGAYVTEVYSGEPAYEGGMRVADVITEIDGEAVSGMSDIYNNLLEHGSGDTVIYTVSRKSGSKKITKHLKIKLG